MNKLIFAALLLLPVSAVGESIEAQMNVSVRVVAGARVEMAAEALTIDEADVAKGYVDVTLPLSVRTNSRQGYVLMVQNVSPMVNDAKLLIGNTEVHVVAESFLKRGGSEQIEIRGRLRLSRNARPGRYAQPIRVTATAL